MLLDERNEFADAVSVVAAAGAAVLGDVIDLSTTPYDLGLGEDIWLVIRTDLSVTAASAGTIQFHVVSDALETLGGGVVANCTTHFATAALVTGASAVAPLRTGDVIAAIKLPAGVNYERYLGVIRTIGTTAVAAGRVDAFITKDYARWLPLADAVN
jgi:hypothetical protein